MVFWVAGIVGILLLIDGFLQMHRSKMNWGLALTFSLGFVLLFVAFFAECISSVVPGSVLRILAAIALLGIAVALAVCFFLFLHGRRDTAVFDEEAAVILGAAIRKGRMSRPLQYRLDKGIEYALRNKEAILVVSGGLGSGESVAEAEAMAAYLLAHGVESKRLLIENHSISTKENFTFSKAILDEKLGNHYRLTFITSCFHIYRAGLYARRAGFHARSLGAKTGMLSVVPCYLREMLAVMRLWILNY